MQTKVKNAIRELISFVEFHEKFKLSKNAFFPELALEAFVIFHIFSDVGVLGYKEGQIIRQSTSDFQSSKENLRCDLIIKPIKSKKILVEFKRVGKHDLITPKKIKADLKETLKYFKANPTIEPIGILVYGSKWIIFKYENENNRHYMNILLMLDYYADEKSFIEGISLLRSGKVITHFLNQLDILHSRISEKEIKTGSAMEILKQLLIDSKANLHANEKKFLDLLYTTQNFSKLIEPLITNYHFKTSG